MHEAFVFYFSANVTNQSVRARLSVCGGRGVVAMPTNLERAVYFCIHSLFFLLLKRKTSGICLLGKSR